MIPAEKKSGHWLEDKYSFLHSFNADFPESLRKIVWESHYGDLRDRVVSALEWRMRLLRGELPMESSVIWPPQPLLGKLLSELRELGAAKYCQENPELTDALLKDIFSGAMEYENSVRSFTLRKFAELKSREEEKRLQELREKEKRRQESAHIRKGVNKLSRKWKGSPAVSAEQSSTEADDEQKEIEIPALSEEELTHLREAAQKIAEEEEAKKAAVLIINDSPQKWRELVAAWREIEDVFGDLGALLRVNGWDLSRGVLQSQGWLKIIRLRKLIKKIPQFREVVQSLGRLQTAQDEEEESIVGKIFESVKRVMEEIRELPTPYAPHDMRGVRRSDDIHRMLPQEAAFFGHPVLKKLWHARRAEKMLLTYQVEGVEPQKIEEQTETEKTSPEKQKRLERGPIICCLDTSGSMSGTPELTAKALTLEAMRTAIAENRKCYLYAFSGPGDINEHELELTQEGLTRFLEFLTLSFHGGTEVDGPLCQAVQKINQEEWHRADILLITDGAFSLPHNDVMQMLNDAKEKNKLKIHGVLVGVPPNSAMETICTHIHQFSGWHKILGE